MPNNVALLLIFCGLTMGCDDGPGASPPSLDDGLADAVIDMPADAMPLSDATVDQQVDADGALDAGLDADANDVLDAAPDQAPVPLPACDPPLSLTPDRAVTPAYGLEVFVAAGGTGDWRFALLDDESGAEIHPTTGAYLADARFDVSDTVLLTDTGCAGEARAQIDIVPPLRIRPEQVTLAPGDGFTFDTEGGSGAVEFRWINRASGGRIEPGGQYTAGPSLGLDVIEAFDPATGLTARARMRVEADPRLTTDPPRLYMARGSQAPFAVQGGSGFFAVEVVGDAAEVDADTLTLDAVSPGRVRLRITDRFVDQRTELTVDVVSPLEPPLRRIGRNTLSTEIHALGDINADGFADVAIAHSEASIDQADDGAVYIYLGGPGGLMPQPAQILFGADRGAAFGRALAVADLNDDDHVDLVVGSWLAPGDGVRRGQVQVFRGGPAGFDVEPFWTAFGPRDEDRLGAALSVCDFDGDGRLDLAVNAHLGARDATPETRYQGAIYLYRGTNDGLAPAPDATPVFGQVRVDDAWVDQPGLRLGQRLASGDFDGDGACDLVAWLPEFSTAEGRRNDGALHLYAGGPDGLSSTPARVWVGDEAAVNQGQLGRRIAMADLNGDGRADIIAGQHGHDDPNFGNDIGTVRVFAGAALDGPWMGSISSGAADWERYGDFPGDQFGVDVAVGDFDGDAHPDLLVGGLTQTAEPVDGIPGPFQGGIARVFRGQADDWPDAAWAFEASGPAEWEGFGSAGAIVGDANGDDQSDLVVMAGRSDALGPDVGQPYFIDGATRARTPLDLPAAVTGAWFGWAIATVPDITGDGRPDLLVGAPEHGALEAPRAGSAFVFPGTANGFATEASAVVDGHRQHSAHDLYGYALAGGDFDGDGGNDIAVLARAEDVFEVLPIGTQIDGNCLNTGNELGVVFIHPTRNGAVAEPAWAVYAPAERIQLESAVFADINGDGLDDLIVGSGQWRNADDEEGNQHGGIAVYLGRPANPNGGLRLICNPALTWQGTAAGAQVGRRILPLGDVDGDGCDEVAFSAHREETEAIRFAGAVRILYGWGAGCAAAPRMAAFSGRENAAEFGFALAMGDVVGDARPDLLVGAPNQIEPLTNQRRGAFTIIDGFWLAGLRPTPVAQRPPFVVHARTGNDVRVIHGRHAGSRFGHGVAATHGIAIVSHLYSPVGRAPRVGGGSMYQLSAEGPQLIAGFVAESWRPESRVGETLVADPDRPWVLFGGAFGAGFQPDAGAVYPLDLAPVD